jgi:hypothetical protein
MNVINSMTVQTWRSHNATDIYSLIQRSQIEMLRLSSFITLSLVYRENVLEKLLQCEVQSEHKRTRRKPMRQERSQPFLAWRQKAWLHLHARLNTINQVQDSSGFLKVAHIFFHNGKCRWDTKETKNHFVTLDVCLYGKWVLSSLFIVFNVLQCSYQKLQIETSVVLRRSVTKMTNLYYKTWHSDACS